MGWTKQKSAVILWTKVLLLSSFFINLDL
jgi:hypothetical protein